MSPPELERRKRAAIAIVKRRRGLCGCGRGLAPGAYYCDRCELSTKAAAEKRRTERIARGLCSCCAMREPQRGKVCDVCKERKREAKRQRAARGLCRQCPKPALGGQKLCRRHKDQRNKYERGTRQRKRDARRRAGLCTICGRKPAKGAARCEQCQRRDHAHPYKAARRRPL